MDACNSRNTYDDFDFDPYKEKTIFSLGRKRYVFNSKLT